MSLNKHVGIHRTPSHSSYSTFLPETLSGETSALVFTTVNAGKRRGEHEARREAWFLEEVSAVSTCGSHQDLLKKPFEQSH